LSRGPLPKLTEFAALLRDNDIPVSTVEVTDAVNALEAIGPPAIAARDAFRATLEATLCKRPVDRPRFRELFHLHFELGDPFDLLPLEPALGEAGEGQELDSLAAALLAGRADRVAAAMREALEAVDLSGMRTRLQVGYFAQRLLARLDAPGIEADLRDLAAPSLVDERMTALRRAARRLVERELEKRDRRAGPDAPLTERAFLRMSDRERDEVRRLIVELAERMRAREQRRDLRRRRGALDVRRTLRASLPTGGVPMRVHHRRRRRDKPEVMVLCDVSDSVEAAAELLLTFVHTLASRFSRVRSFVFVDEVGEVSDLLRAHPLDEALARVRRGDAVSVFRNSDYGQALRGFTDRHLGEISRRAHVIILGDGRSNHRDPGLEALEDLRQRARALWWVCPESRGTWGAGDSVMTAYARRCDEVFVARNVRELRLVVDRLLR
jgi:uncharacterized protein with von Willebrand factor type A (vWA) domain